MKQYPGEQQTVEAVLNVYRSMQKDFRSDISQARVQQNLAPLVSDLKRYVGKNSGSLPDSYESMVPQLANKIYGLMDSVDQNGDVHKYLVRTYTLLNEINVMLGRAMYSNKPLPLEAVCHNIDAAYINLRTAMES
jgi:hypothetical protein